MRTITHDFIAEGQMSTLVREIAAHIEMIDPNARALYEGVIGDLEIENMKLRQDLAFWTELPVGAMK